jgi:hypothetical protein
MSEPTHVQLFLDQLVDERLSRVQTSQPAKEQPISTLPRPERARALLSVVLVDCLVNDGLAVLEELDAAL